MTKANEAKEKTEIASITEEIQREILEEQLKSTRGKLTAEALKTILTSKGTLSTEENILDRTLTTTKGGYEIAVRDIWDGTLSSTSGGTGEGGGTGDGGETGGGGGSGSGSGLTDTADTKPGAAMPSGATVVEANPSNGIVIRDSKNNEWVWIEVPKTTVFKKATASDQYDNIKADLIKYATDYREGKAGQGCNWTDEWYDGCGIAERETYITTYHKMLSSVYTNGGFWIGRYEAGVSDTTQRTAEGEITGLEAKSQPDMYPFNYVTCSQAQTLASAMSTDSSKTSSLMFGIQWDLVCKFLEGKDGLTTAKINSDSYSWGNYRNSEIKNLSGKYAICSQTDPYPLGAWNTIPDRYTKPSSGTKSWVLLSTGASEYTKKMNIYDFAGNELEWTLEKTSDTIDPCAYRGGCYTYTGSDYPASSRSDVYTSYSNDGISFRPSLY